MIQHGVTNTTVASYLYASPGMFIVDYPVGTPERDAAIEGYAHVQRKLCIAGICIAALIFIVSLFLRNPYLGDEQTLPGAEGFVEPGQINELPKRGHSEGEDAEQDANGNDHKGRHPTAA
jgi:SIT family siderophore-iron:H+ symporter-like MFS transporter